MSHSVAFLLYYLITYFGLKFSLKMNRNHLSWIFVLIIFVILMLPLQDSVLYRHFAIFSAFNIWSLIFFMRSLRSPEQLTLVNFSTNTMSPFLLSVIPIVTPHEKSWNQAEAHANSESHLLRTFKLLILCFALLTVQRWIVSASSYIRFFNYTLLATDGYQAGFVRNFQYWMDEPIWMSWLLFIFSYLYAFLKIYLYLVPSVLLYQLIGFDLKAPIYNLFKSKSLYEFFENFNHYYNKIIVEVFTIPLLSFFKSKKLQTQMLIPSFFISIVIGGLLYHFVRWPNLFLSSDLFENFFEFLSSCILYWVLLGATASLSMLIERRQKLDSSRYRPFRWIVYLVINSALFVWVINYNYPVITIQDRLTLFLQLFGIR